MRKYLVVIEKGRKNLSAFCPGLPGCVAAGGTKREVRRNIRGAIALHLEGMREDGLPVPRDPVYAVTIAL